MRRPPLSLTTPRLPAVAPRRLPLSACRPIPLFVTAFDPHFSPCAFSLTPFLTQKPRSVPNRTPNFLILLVLLILFNSWITKPAFIGPGSYGQRLAGSSGRLKSTASSQYRHFTGTFSGTRSSAWICGVTTSAWKTARPSYATFTMLAAA